MFGGFLVFGKGLFGTFRGFFCTCLGFFFIHSWGSPVDFEVFLGTFPAALWYILGVHFTVTCRHPNTTTNMHTQTPHTPMSSRMHI